MGAYVVLLLFSIAGIHAQNDGEAEEDEDYITWIGVGVGVGLSIVFLGCGIIFCSFLTRSVGTHRNVEDDRDHLIEEVDGSSMETEHIMMSSLSQTSFTMANNKWEIPVESIRITTKLGKGEFGHLYDAELMTSNGTLMRALVKTFEGGDYHWFQHEVEILKKFRHSRVGRMLGIVSQVFPYQLVLELPLNGDLKSFLTKVSTEDNISIATRDLVQMAFDVACGLEYLHSIGHIHSDVAARNCMVTQKLVVKITDYGVGPDLFKKDYCVYKGTHNVPVRWLPPESLLELIHNVATNVWSYGILFWEVMTYCVMPYLELNNSQVVVAIIEKDRRLIHPKQCPSQLFKFIETCWERDPKQRPSMTDVCKELDKYLAVTEEYRVQHNRLPLI